MKTYIYIILIIALLVFGYSSFTKQREEITGQQVGTKQVRCDVEISGMGLNSLELDVGEHWYDAGIIDPIIADTSCVHTGKYCSNYDLSNYFNFGSLSDIFYHQGNIRLLVEGKVQDSKTYDFSRFTSDEVTLYACTNLNYINLELINEDGKLTNQKRVDIR